MRDAWLLKRFPGRTLEELDGMDYGRLVRAFEADRIEHAETLSKQYLADEVKDLPAEVWAQLERNDKWLD